MFTEEAHILLLVKEGLLKHWSEQSEGRFEANEVENRSNFSSIVGSSNTTINDGTKVDASSQQEEFNEITPKSSRKRHGENEPSVADKLSSLVTKDKTIITPTITQTQIDVSAEKDIANEAVCEKSDDIAVNVENEVSNSVRVQSKKTKDYEKRAWEQMKLSFNRIEKSQKQREMTELLLRNNSAESEVESSVHIQPKKPCLGNRLSSKSNYTVEKEASSILDHVANSEATESAQGLRSSDRRTGEKVEEETVQSEVGNRLKQKVEDLNAVSLSDSLESSTDCDKNHDDWNDQRGEKDSLIRRKVRAEDLGNRSGRMVSSKRILSSKRLQPVLGRAREKGNANASTVSSPQRCSKRNRSEASVPDQVEREPITIWDSFSGTQSVIAQSRQSQIQLLKRRKAFRENNTEAEESSSAVKLCHEDFLHMSIVGQFNLGFILARCRNQNLWILDQHACDEKYNFERLCKETVMHEQKLITPLQLELSPSEENCVLEHMDVFERNGFRFHYNPEEDPRRRLSLTALPHSGSGGDGTKAVQFGKEGTAAVGFKKHDGLVNLLHNSFFV